MLEKDIEDRVCRYARKLGAIAYKFTSPQRRSVPDRIFLFPGGVVLFVEFKQAGKKPTSKQQREITRLRNLGFRVEIIDDVDKGKLLIDDTKTLSELICENLS